ncbi:hypothetical protein Mal64_16410 [Pseudobythopirellula maris]|uniref:Uncharacterized protein n=1 Tax=Pseudobythopirellula maris TaxID=2527991 RepID=A0A5C5ZL52_9BACT|nr:DUF3365 domain-containing protein [Pseudobythopirellula maris]TWT88164.1 hypothetical protein Mal64_16410 [Pseudobythopirellula maris]
MSNQPSEPDSPPRVRFTIFDLSVVTAFLAVALSPISWLGEFYLMNLVPSLALVVLVGYALWKRSTVGAFVVVGAFLFLIVAVGGVIMFIPTATLNHTALTLVALLATLPWRGRQRVVAAACGLAFLVTYGSMLHGAYNRALRVDALRAAYPRQSIAELMRAAVATEADTAIAQGIPVGLNKAQDGDLTALEEEHDQSYWWRSRSGLLKRLQEDSYRRFVAASGFGVGRFLEGSLLGVEDEPPAAVGDRLPAAISTPFVTDALRDLHGFSRSNFLDPDRIGYVDSTGGVVGFTSHAFVRPPGVPRNASTYEDEARGSWRLLQLDLVSLLLHDEPVAYVSDKLPNMEELGVGVPTRGLDAFEREALPKLYRSSDLEVVETPTDEGTHIRMLGAIRAAASCAVCHPTQRGALLGAFSYELLELEGQDGKPLPDGAAPGGEQSTDQAGG